MIKNTHALEQNHQVFVLLNSGRVHSHVLSEDSTKRVGGVFGNATAFRACVLWRSQVIVPAGFFLLRDVSLSLDIREPFCTVILLARRFVGSGSVAILFTHGKLRLKLLFWV